MKIKKLTTKVKVVKQLIGEQYDEWIEISNEINNIKPTGNYGSEAVDRAFADMVAALDHFVFSIKK